MNQAQAAELLKVLDQILQALVRIEKLLTEEFGPGVGREQHQEPLRLDENSGPGSVGRAKIPGIFLLGDLPALLKRDG